MHVRTGSVGDEDSRGHARPDLGDEVRQQIRLYMPVPRRHGEPRAGTASVKRGCGAPHCRLKAAPQRTRSSGKRSAIACPTSLLARSNWIDTTRELAKSTAPRQASVRFVCAPRHDPHGIVATALIRTARRSFGTAARTSAFQ